MSAWDAKADAARYAREKGITYSSGAEARAVEDAKRAADPALAEWVRVALSESRDEFYARLGIHPAPVKRALVGQKVAAKRFSGEAPTPKRVVAKRPACVVAVLKARIRELEAQLAEINSVFA